MSKGSNQKLKLLYIAEYLLQNTDEEHTASVKDIIKMLDGYGISAERKSIYDDIAALCDFGMDIETIRGKGNEYHLVSRDFELAELKLLVDAVQSSKFITEKKSRELIKKLSGLCSRHEAMSLERQVFVTGRPKTPNEHIFLSVDAIHTAILSDSLISFRYFDYSVDKEKVLHHDGKPYIASPLVLIWEDENYYLIAYDTEAKSRKTYRVDKMIDISVLNEKRNGAGELSDSDKAGFTKKVFGMWGGEEDFVTLECKNTLAGVMMDRFGNDITFIKHRENETFEISVPVVLSPQFYSWVFGFSGRVRILSPQKAVDGFKKQLKDIAAQYENCVPSEE